MLLSLHIENIALIRRLDWDIGGAFNVLTGETGAGKSILIDSIGLLLGDRFEKGLIRTGETEAVVTGLVSDLPPDVLAPLRESGIVPDEDGNLQLSRRISSDGKSRARINGVSVSLAQLKAVGEQAIGILGQSDHQLLRDEGAYCRYLDRYAGTEKALEDYRAQYAEYTSLLSQIDSLSHSERDRIQRLDILSFQLKEIDAMKLKAGEEETLRAEEKRIKGAERIENNARYAWTALRGADKGNVCVLLEKSASALEKLSEFVPNATKMSSELTECRFRIEEVAGEVYDLLAFHRDEDPEAALDRLETRLAGIERLKKKYGATVEEIIEWAQKLRAEWELLSHADERMQELQADLSACLARLEERAAVLHTQRAEAARRLATQTVEILRYLDMENVVFTVDVERLSREDGRGYTSGGGDRVLFRISANKGEASQSLAKVASGGELARIMLALQTVIAGQENVGTFIFDEIDAGVSGKTSRKLGIRLLALSRCAQVLCVTHSAQVASLADCHYKISKSTVQDRTETSVTPLDGEGRLAEISRIMGSIDVTESQRQAARDLLDERRTILAGF